MLAAIDGTPGKLADQQRVEAFRHATGDRTRTSEQKLDRRGYREEHISHLVSSAELRGGETMEPAQALHERVEVWLA